MNAVEDDHGIKEVTYVKRSLLIIAVAALALTLVPLAVAGAGHGGWKHGKAKFNLVGTLKLVNVTADPDAPSTVVIKVKAGTKTVRAFRGHEELMDVAGNAKVRLLTEHGAVVATLDQLPLDVKAKVRGTIDRSDPANPVFIIKDIKVKAPLPAP